ncbi:MAG: DHH family phosphoesterase [Bacteroidales bacterium]|nr:DHH family phosphoesterase [Bacteroidales bacterium]
MQHKSLALSSKPEFAVGLLCHIKAMVDNAKRVVLTAHTHADGDAVGAVTGLMSVLGRLYPDLNLTPMLPQGCPRQFEWMPGAALILSGESERERCCQALAEADMIFVLDLNTPSRLDNLAQPFTQATGHKILVDHHISPDQAAFQTIISDHTISSTCELATWLVEALWGAQAIGSEAATCFYTGMRTDTGGFAYSNTQPSLYHAAAMLIGTGIDPAEINNRIVNIFSERRLRFYGYAISNCLTVMAEQHFAYFAISLDVQRHFGVGYEDMDGLVNYTTLMSDIEFGALIREEKQRCKVSLRSKHTDVESIARQLFGGGGHRKAAGATSTLPLAETVEKLTQYVASR